MEHRCAATRIDDVGPPLYQDPLGAAYEVHITDYGVTAVRYERKQATGIVTEPDYTLVLEHVPDTPYTP